MEDFLIDKFRPSLGKFRIYQSPLFFTSTECDWSYAQATLVAHCSQEPEKKLASEPEEAHSTNLGLGVATGSCW